jgi:hypothetical protein
MHLLQVRKTLKTVLLIGGSPKETVRNESEWPIDIRIHKCQDPETVPVL